MSSIVPEKEIEDREKAKEYTRYKILFYSERNDCEKNKR